MRMKNCMFIIDLGHDGIEGFEKTELYYTNDIYDAAKVLVDMHDKGYDAINLYWRGKSDNDGTRTN